MENIIRACISCFYFLFVSKSNLLKAQGAQPNYTGSIQEKNTKQDQEWRKRVQKVFKVRDIEKGINIEPLKRVI